MLPFQIIDGMSVYSVIWVVECGNNAYGLFPHSTEGKTGEPGESGERREGGGGRDSKGH